MPSSSHETAPQNTEFAATLEEAARLAKEYIECLTALTGPASARMNALKDILLDAAENGLSAGKLSAGNRVLFEAHAAHLDARLMLLQMSERELRRDEWVNVHAYGSDSVPRRRRPW